MKLVSTKCQHQQPQSSGNVCHLPPQTSPQQRLTPWLFSAGIAAATVLSALPAQAITIGQVKTQVTPYVPRSYTVLDLETGGYVPLNANGNLTIEDFFYLNADSLATVTSNAQTASTNAFSVSNPTGSLGSVNTATTVTGAGAPGYRSVFNTNGINLDGENKFTINAARGETVILNIFGNLNLSGGAAIELTGGVKVDNVLVNVLGDVSLSGNSGVFGTILAVNDGSSTMISGGTVGGTLVGRNIALADATIDGVYFVPEPLTILGTLTATGFAAVFKKESSKKQKKEKTKV